MPPATRPNLYSVQNQLLRTHSAAGCQLSAAWPDLDVGHYVIEGIARDAAGRTSTERHTFSFALSIEPPDDVQDVTDSGLEGEEPDWTNDPTKLSGSWDASEGAASYEYCFSSQLDCTGTVVEGWAVTNVTETIVSGLSLANGERYLLCVRARTVGGARTAISCSDGVTVDISPPAAPSAVRDGDQPGLDTTETPSTYLAAANWDAAADIGGGVARYETCISKLGVPCATDEEWVEDGVNPLLLAVSRNEELDLGTTIAMCVRAADAANNISAPTCSTGQRVMPATQEVVDNMEVRLDFGLPATESTVRALLVNPPAEGYDDEMGFVMTASEAARLYPQLAAGESAADTAQAYGAQFPDAYAGSFIHPRKANHLIVGFTKNLPRHQRRLLKRIIHNSHVRPKVKFRLRKYSLRSLEATSDRIIQNVPVLLANGYPIVTVEVNVPTNEVVVGVDGSKQVVKQTRRTLRQEYGTMLETIERETPNISVHRRRPMVTRENALHWTQAAMPGTNISFSFQGPMLVSGNCTLGYSIVVNEHIRALTAAHCSDPNPCFEPRSQCPGNDQFAWSLDWFFDSGQVALPAFGTSATDSHVKHFLGKTVSRPADADVVVLELASETYGTGNVFIKAKRGSPRARHVSGVVRPEVYNSRVCKSSNSEGTLVRKGYMCGPLKAFNVWAVGARLLRCCQREVRSCGGDSGGPSFWISPDDRSVTKAVGSTWGSTSSGDFNQATLGTADQFTITHAGEQFKCDRYMAYNPLRRILRAVDGELYTGL